MKALKGLDSALPNLFIQSTAVDIIFSYFLANRLTTSFQLACSMEDTFSMS